MEIDKSLESDYIALNLPEADKDGFAIAGDVPEIVFYNFHGEYKFTLADLCREQIREYNSKDVMVDWLRSIANELENE